MKEKIKNKNVCQQSCAEAAVKDCDKLFDQLISSMQKRRSEVKQLITAQEKTAITQVKELRLQQGKEIAKLRTRDALLERLLHTDDHIYLIQVPDTLRRCIQFFKVDASTKNMFCLLCLMFL